MNINDYERMERDPEFRDRVAFAHFYATGQAADPRFTALWARVPDDVKRQHAEIGLKVIHRSLVDDYTTPGCDCPYCTWDSPEQHGRLIMCRQRWAAFPQEQRREIADSVNG